MELCFLRLLRLNCQWFSSGKMVFPPFFRLTTVQSLT